MSDLRGGGGGGHKRCGGYVLIEHHNIIVRPEEKTSIQKTDVSDVSPREGGGRAEPCTAEAPRSQAKLHSIKEAFSLLTFHNQCATAW